MRGLFIPAAGAILLALSGPAAARCPDSGLTPIAELRGPDPAVATGDAVRARGVVTADYRDEKDLNGFYLQSSISRADGLPSGIFVYAPEMTADDGSFGPGSEVVVTGEAAEYRGRRQIAWVDSVRTCGRPGLPEAVQLPFPENDRQAWHRYRGLRVTLDADVTVTSNYRLARYGSLTVAGGGRLFSPNRVSGEPAVPNPARRLVLDDGSYSRDSRPVPYLDNDSTRRLGSVVEDLTGVLAHAFGEWRLHPSDTAMVRFRPDNPRPDPPSRTADSYRMVAFNVNNYFLTPGERGARNRSALDSQRRRLRAAAEGLKADLVGLTEIENRPGAVADLAGHMTQADGRSDGGYAHFGIDRKLGTDAIRVALAWNPDRVERLAGPFVDDASVHDRPPIAGHFRFGDDGPGTLVTVIHHKARSGCPDTGDVDQGQGCWNERRMQQSRALTDFLARHRRRLGTDRVLILGDFNSHATEDPIAVLREAGFDDLLQHVPAEDRYTYVFRGEAGSLDGAFASPALSRRVRGVDIWHINADEPAALHEFASSTGPWRSSDHDPVVVDVDAGSR